MSTQQQPALAVTKMVSLGGRDGVAELLHFDHQLTAFPAELVWDNMIAP